MYILLCNTGISSPAAGPSSRAPSGRGATCYSYRSTRTARTIHVTAMGPLGRPPLMNNK